MRTLTGLPAAPGIALGPVFVYHRTTLHAVQAHVDDTDRELARLDSALQQAEADLASLEQRARKQVGDEEAAIFQAHIAMLRDPELLERVRSLIQEQKINVDFAWQESVQFFANTLRDLNDDYLSARAADVEDVGQRVLSLLLGQVFQPSQPETASIILADDLAPADTILFERGTVLGYGTQGGGPTSHVAILSKAQGVPCVVGLGGELASIPNGTFVIVDGGSGVILVEPDSQTKADYEARALGHLEYQRQAHRDASLPAQTSDGKRVEVVANVGSAADALEAVQYGAEGIGLLRTEFLFLDRASAPEEAEQFKAYAAIFKVIGHSRPIVVRTLDIGGDKPAGYLSLPHEENPFLGLRGIRLTLRNLQLFENQLRALLAAGNGYDLRIMFPMVSTLEEFHQAREVLARCQSDLRAAGTPFAEKVQLGIMVEVPSAAILAEAFAEVVDFFSIGTNDLSQYTLAAERTSAEVAYLADAFQPAVLQLIRQVIEAAHRRGKWVGVCGELAGEPLAVPVLLGLQLDEFSASPKLIPEIKHILRKWSTLEAAEVAQHALQLSGAGEIRSYLQTVLQKTGTEK